MRSEWMRPIRCQRRSGPHVGGWAWRVLARDGRLGRRNPHHRGGLRRYRRQGGSAPTVIDMIGHDLVTDRSQPNCAGRNRQRRRREAFGSGCAGQSAMSWSTRPSSRPVITAQHSRRPSVVEKSYNLSYYCRMSVVNFRTDERSERALAELMADGSTASDAIRQALVDAVRLRRREQMRVESLALMNDDADRAESRQVLSEMDELRAW